MDGVAQSAKTETATPTADEGKAKPRGKAATAKKANKPAKAPKSDAEGEATDRLATTLDELKETKGGFVAFHFLTGKDKDAIAICARTCVIWPAPITSSRQCGPRWVTR